MIARTLKIFSNKCFQVGVLSLEIPNTHLITMILSTSSVSLVFTELSVSPTESIQQQHNHRLQTLMGNCLESTH